MARSPLQTVPMPDRIARRPRDDRGFPVPWFVLWKDGKPLFPVADTSRMMRALKFKRCWVCGEPLGRNVALVLGPMCVANRITAEPPNHRECALYALRVCPFLIQPRMGRVKLEKFIPLDEVHEAAGFPNTRNPGVCALWVTREYYPFAPTMGGNGMLIKFGEPSEVRWFRAGREATPEEALAGFEASCDVLRNMAAQEGPDATAECARQIERARHHLPALAAS